MEINTLKDVQVLIDVGAKDTSYPIEYPKAVCHLFEPNFKYCSDLYKRFGENKKVIINNYGLGDKDESLGYDPYTESCVAGTYRDFLIPIKTLDWYMQKHHIDRVDLLKIDAEGMDLKVLLGGASAIKLARYIQYEHWDNNYRFAEMLGEDFEMEDIGERNILCTRKS